MKDFLSIKLTLIFYLTGKQTAIPGKQKPARVTNRSAGFGSSCLLTE